ncbi:MAG: group I intron-associated PD-(D/E)XK endonuclease [Terriglobales bacterium]
MKKRKPKIIRDNKKRGEWAESVFAARAAENGLQISKPFGDSGRFDCVVGTPGKFAAVQVKCTIAKQHNAKGYICNLKSNNKKYRPRSFDFLAAYAILEDTWYIVPEKAIRGMGAICLCSTMPKYEEYREAWHLLKSPLLATAARNGAPGASGCEETAEEPPSESDETRMGVGLARMQAAMNSFRNYMEKGGV